MHCMYTSYSCLTHKFLWLSGSSRMGEIWPPNFINVEERSVQREEHLIFSYLGRSNVIATSFWFLNFVESKEMVCVFIRVLDPVTLWQNQDWKWLRHFSSLILFATHEYTKCLVNLSWVPEVKLSSHFHAPNAIPQNYSISTKQETLTDSKMS